MRRIGALLAGALALALGLAGSLAGSGGGLPVTGGHPATAAAAAATTTTTSGAALAPTRAPAPAATLTRAPAQAPTLTGARPCRGQAEFVCSTLRVPLDHGGATPGTLALRVAAARNVRAPGGVLVFLTGGPGQPGVPFAGRVRRLLEPVARRYRLVLIDQRGTGLGALRCPALQRAVGSSDVTVPPPGSVEDCARTIGERRFYATADTVADLEALRRALGAHRLTLDGVSYGAFVAQRYAMAHPRRVRRLVLDSVVPAAGLDGLDVDAMRSVARVLRAVCRAERCATDPVADLAAIVRRDGLGPRLFDTLVAMSVVAPSFDGVATALRAARAGRPARLQRLMARVRREQAATAGQLSQGLHAATLCADLRAPWGGPQAPIAGREERLRRVAARLDPAPFDRATLTATGLIQTCLRWPPTPAPPAPTGRLPAVPTLLLAGERDLSTPLAWARRQAARTPAGRLVVVPGAGHSVQSRSPGDVGRRATLAFLAGR